MEHRAPVFTEEASCQDCYKCLRACPVKAIQVSHGHAQVRPEACIVCGRCVAACPPKAKRLRDDLPSVRELLAAGGTVVASLAPSWVAEFPDLSPGHLVAALRHLGFTAVSETALGARAVSAAIVDLRRREPQRLHLSTACPAATDFIRKHRPHLVAALTPVGSPAQIHARMLQAAYGAQTRVVLISPCAAKKREADDRPELLAAALTFADLRRWLDDAGIVPAQLAPGAEDCFVLGAAAEGARYPLEGGMLGAIRAHGDAGDGLAAWSGIADLDLALAGLDPASAGMFIETLSCAGGCINGPGMTISDGLLRRRARVLGADTAGGQDAPPAVPAELAWTAIPEPCAAVDERQVTAALARLGKTAPADELNCAGCGYDSCRDLARALCAGRAEPEQCVAWMRRLAQRKANALLAAMPAGAVLVDERLVIIDANRTFARLLGVEERFLTGGLVGVPVGEVSPFARQFRHVLDGHGDLLERDHRIEGRVLHGSLFTVEPGRVAGAVLVDVTAPAMSRAQVAERAREAITKHLATVQRIAYLLGENAAETEDLLGQIVEAHGGEPQP
jgi:Na+-translocating ferredoxin:NAD+ oxidoreductase RNF subunit RnfB